ncbi:hypothetical protein FFLO_06295 [Filobasidium floriforme]|uniref:Uncharacterized protein n=1 Tax=Filobasidium floriforme TaxID=5210 RepID=A0A8K0JFF7_9TREE|nr:uncharacterized protein HD553DRAFT_342403 [Filobasidium floriforme]KAG7528263.1 hypothetical protein FFLO_06295 [Filobasidium floriforme]KAH8084017.1 hypothetical protein HD553DRAFT_342403 [Filobasidium floriforme]
MVAIDHGHKARFREGFSPVEDKNSATSIGPVVLSKGESSFKPTERWYKRRKWRIFLIVSIGLIISFAVGGQQLASWLKEQRSKLQDKDIVDTDGRTA